MRHDVEILSAARRIWAKCSCGWRGSDWTTASGASIDFAEHLAAPTTNQENR